MSCGVTVNKNIMFHELDSCCGAHHEECAYKDCEKPVLKKRRISY